MFEASKHSDGQGTPVTVALLAIAVLFIPALVVVSQPASYFPALSISALCLTLAWFHWKRSQKAAIPVVDPTREAAK